MFDFANWMLVFVRVSSLLTVFPILSTPHFPARVRVALAALLAFMVAPTLPTGRPLPESFTGLVGLLASEVGVGLMLGFVARLLFYALEFAGGIMATEMGLNMAASMNPLDSSRSDAPGMLLFNLGAVLFFSLDLHHAILLAFERSYQILPAGGARLGAALLDDMVGRTAQVFVIGLLISAPTIAVSYFVNLVFSVVGGAVPQMNIFVESFSFRVLAGLVVLGATIQLMAQHIVNYLKRLPEDLMRVIQLLAGG